MTKSFPMDHASLKYCFNPHLAGWPGATPATGLEEHRVAEVHGADRLSHPRDSVEMPLVTKPYKWNQGKWNEGVWEG